MLFRRGNTSPNGQMQPCPGGWLKSFAATLLGAAVMGCGLNLMERVLHSGLMALTVGWLALLPFAAGWLVAAVDGRRPLLVAAAACLLSAPFLVAAWAADAPHIPLSIGNIAATALPPIPAAVIAAGAAGWIRKRRPSFAAAGSFILLVGLVLALIVPWRLHWRDAKRFLGEHQSEVIAAANDEPFHIPDGSLRWRTELWGHFHRGVHLKAEWDVTTRIAGRGHCAVDIGVAWQRDGQGYVVREIHFSHFPYAPVLLRTSEDALAILRQLGATPSPGASELFWHGRQGWRWSRLSARFVQGGPPDYVVIVQRNGRVAMTTRI